MVDSNYVFLLSWQTILTVFSFVLMILAFRKHREKYSEATNYLSWMFFFIVLATLVKTIGTLYAYIDSPQPFSFGIWANRDPFRLGAYLLAYFLLITGVYFLNKIGTLIFQKKKRRNIITLILMLVLIAYGTLQFFFNRERDFFSNPIVDILTSIDPWILVFVLIITVSLSVQCGMLMRKMDKSDPIYQHVLGMLLLNIFLILTMGTYAMVTVWRTITGNLPNIFSYVSDFLAVFSMFMAYIGFFRKIPR